MDQSNMVRYLLPIVMLRTPRLSDASMVPLYRQLYDFIRSEIETGTLCDGERLPATRELAVQIGLNRTTVSAAYGLLEAEGLIKGHVGRGSFVNYEPSSVRPQAPAGGMISFASSRPSDVEFPMSDLSATLREVSASAEMASILQLGAPGGFAPLRRYLLEHAREEGSARADDDILITSGCQQALDLLQRVLAASGETVVVEDPVYHGLKNVFARGGTRLLGVSVGRDGADLDALSRILKAERPQLAVLTPNFQNPTGATMPEESRHRVAEAAYASGTLLVENDIYGDLRYEGEPLPTIKQSGGIGQVALMRSFSKLAFPGLRVGWVIAPRPLIARLAEAKQWCDLHTDQLSQAVLLRFAESGRLAEHRSRMRASGAVRLRTVLAACARHLPQGTEWTRPEGGMSLWVRLPEPLDAAELLPRAERANVSYLPGRHFAVTRPDPCALRLSFGALTPEQIEEGIARLGRVCREELQRVSSAPGYETAPAVV